MRACPNCRYDLKGLPSEHTCPECGIGYDEHCIVIKLKPVEWAYQRLTLPIVMLCFTLYAILRTGFVHEDLYGLGFIAAIIIASLWRAARKVGGVHLLVINRSGIEFRHADSAQSLIAWDDFESACIGILRSKLILKDRGTRVLYSCTVRSLGGLRVSKRCVSAINTNRGLYAGDTTPKPTTDLPKDN